MLIISEIDRSFLEVCLLLITLVLLVEGVHMHCHEALVMAPTVTRWCTLNVQFEDD